MPDLIRHPEPLKRLDSGFRRNDNFFSKPQFMDRLCSVALRGGLSARFAEDSDLELKRIN